MKILHIIDSGGLYGAEVMLLNLVAEQVRSGLEPVIASIGTSSCGEKPLEFEARRRGLKIEVFRMRPGLNVAGAFDVLRFARNEGVNVFHSHGYKGNILFGLMPPWLRRIPMVSTVHGWTWSGGLNRMGVYEWLDRQSLRFIDRVVLVNGAMLDRVKLKRVDVVDNGISTLDSTNSMSSKGALDPEIKAFCRTGFIIGALGRLSREKGFDILLDAVKEVADRCPDVRLLILGEGGERGALEAKARGLGIEDRVLMPGYVADARRYFSVLGLFVLPSLTEGLPMVILEAMSAGVPIVASRVGGIPEVLENGESGYLIEPGSAKAIRDGILEVIGNPGATRQRTNKARQRVAKRYSSQAMALKYLEIYHSLLQCSLQHNDIQQTQKAQ